MSESEYDPILRAKKDLEYELRLWTAEKKRAMELTETIRYAKTGKLRIKEADREIKKIEGKLETLKDLQQRLKEVMST